MHYAQVATTQGTAADFNLRIPIAKMDDDQRLIVGWAAVVTKADGTPVVDLQGDLTPISEIEKAAHKALRFGGRGKSGVQHEATGIGDIVESFVVSKSRREALGFGPGPEGWVVAMKIHDDDVWKRIKSGELSELSFKGTARRTPIAA